MTIDTNSMRELLRKAPGKLVAVDVDDMHQLLDVVDAGQSAAIALANLGRLVPAVAIAA